MDKNFIDIVSNNMSDQDRKLLYSYLSFFQPALKEEFLKIFPNAICDKWEPDAVADVVKPLMFFKHFGISLKSILNSVAWSMLLDDLLDRKYTNILKALGPLRTRENELYIIRAGYRYGHPLVDDDTYDILLSLYVNTFNNLIFFKEQAYDDDIYDPLIIQVLKSFGIFEEYKVSLDKEVMDFMNREKSTSILPVSTYDEVYQFLSDTNIEKILFSLKIDGVNTKKGYKDGIFTAGLSRGRSSDSLDYTAALHHIIPNKISTLYHLITVTSEAYVEPDYLEILRNKYPKKQFKTSKSSAISLLRNPSNYDKEDLKHLKVLSFDSDGLGSDKLEIYSNLTKQGFTVPPNIIVDKKDIPLDFQEFIVWLNKILDEIREQQLLLNLPADGVVCEKIGKIIETRKDQYSDSNIAIKFSYWASQCYTSVVKNIIIEQRRVNASVVLEIEPVITNDGNIATRVNGGSLAILINNGIKIGSVIQFERKSSAYNVLVLEG